MDLCLCYPIFHQTWKVPEEVNKKLAENMCTQTPLKKAKNLKELIILVMPVNLNQHKPA